MFSVLQPSTSSSSQLAQESSTPFLTAILPGVQGLPGQDWAARHGSFSAFWDGTVVLAVLPSAAEMPAA